jgi:tRNA (Thr-GGU) A37 N-methylase
MMTETIVLKPIGHVRGGRAEPIDDDWDSVDATIELDETQFKPDATASLDAFSHIEVVFHFNRVPDALVGIFAQRGKGRPNRIGVTVCRLLAADGLRLKVRGLDAIDGTPVLDIKPVMRGFLPRGDVREPDWAAELMAGYW